jgi:hypothetical protein
MTSSGLLALRYTPCLKVVKVTELQTLQELAAKLLDQVFELVGRNTLYTLCEPFFYREYINVRAVLIESNAVPGGYEVLRAGLVDEPSELAQAPPQRAARVVGHIPEERTKPIAAVRTVGHGQVGEERTGLLRWR